VPDLLSIQNTLKLFIMDLDYKEAYEFSMLNPFLINEEELQKLIININERNSDAGMENRNEESDSQEEEDESEDSEELNDAIGSGPLRQIQASLERRRNPRKSLMNIDLEKITSILP